MGGSRIDRGVVLWGIASLGIVLFWLICVPVATADEPSKEMVRFSDDFQKDTRSEYQITGKIEWEPGKLVLGEGAVIRKPIKAGAVGELTLDIKWPELEDGQEARLRIVFEVEEGKQMVVELSGEEHLGQTQTTIRIISTSPPSSLARLFGGKAKESVAREFHDVGKLISAPLRVQLRHGLVRLWRNEQLAAIGYLEVAGTVAAFRCQSVGTAVRCSSVCLVAESARPEFTPQEIADLQELKSLKTQMARLYNVGEMDEAVRVAMKALVIRKRVFGENHRVYANALDGLAMFHNSMGEYAQAQRLCQQALEIRKKVFGEEHPIYAGSLSNLAKFHRDAGHYSKAEPLLVRACEVSRTVLGEKHSSYATVLNNLALLYASMGNYTKAEPLCATALKIRKDVLGERHPDYAASLMNSGGLSYQMGRYMKAEQFLIEADECFRALFGERHTYCVKSQHNLAVLYHEMGEHAKAEPLYVNACTIAKDALGEKHPDYATFLTNLARLYMDTSEYTRAEQLLVQAQDVRRRVFGENSPDFAQSLQYLAEVHHCLGDYAKVESFLLQSLNIRRRVLGKEHPDYAISLGNLGIFYQEMGQYSKAEPILREAHEILRKKRGADHPDYVESMYSLAMLYHSTGEYARAESFARAAFSREVKFAEETATSLPESSARAFEEWKRGPDLLLHILRKLPGPCGDRAYTAVWTSRGLVSQKIAQRHSVIVESAQAQQALSRLRDVSQQLAQTTLALPNPDQRQARQERLAELNEKKEALERELAEVSRAFRQSQQVRAAEVADLAALLADDTAVVELLRVGVWDDPRPGEKRSGAWHYEAFVLAKVGHGAGLHRRLGSSRRGRADR